MGSHSSLLQFPASWSVFRRGLLAPLLGAAFLERREWTRLSPADITAEVYALQILSALRYGQTTERTRTFSVRRR